MYTRKLCFKISRKFRAFILDYIYDYKTSYLPKHYPIFHEKTTPIFFGIPITETLPIKLKDIKHYSLLNVNPVKLFRNKQLFPTQQDAINSIDYIGNLASMFNGYCNALTLRIIHEWIKNRDLLPDYSNAVDVMIGDVPLEYILKNPKLKWNWFLLSQDSRVTPEIVKNNPDIPWNKVGLAWNPNLTLEMICHFELYELQRSIGANKAIPIKDYIENFPNFDPEFVKHRSDLPPHKYKEMFPHMDVSIHDLMNWSGVTINYIKKFMFKKYSSFFSAIPAGEFELSNFLFGLEWKINRLINLKL